MDDATDRGYTEAIITAVGMGLNPIDTSLNYRNQRSELDHDEQEEFQRYLLLHGEPIYGVYPELNETNRKKFADFKKQRRKGFAERTCQLVFRSGPPAMVREPNVTHCSHKAALSLRIGDALRRKNFERHKAVEVRVAGLLHIRIESTPPEFGKNTGQETCAT
jgi:hypothetical protein